MLFLTHLFVLMSFLSFSLKLSVITKKESNSWITYYQHKIMNMHSSPIYYIAVIFIAVLLTNSEAKRKYENSDMCMEVGAGTQ